MSNSSQERETDSTLTTAPQFEPRTGGDSTASSRRPVSLGTDLVSRGRIDAPNYPEGRVRQVDEDPRTAMALGSWPREVARPVPGPRQPS